MADTLEFGSMLPTDYEAPTVGSGAGGDVCLVGKAPLQRATCRTGHETYGGDCVGGHSQCTGDDCTDGSTTYGGDCVEGVTT